ncbi:hypothetical protein PVAP13_5NG354162 [Panicum virgatum]|uniref:Uncharacterized protein n=1 Tax=Panicum virgatum TaxID=38727 RepID=A0A8T0RVU0_PANVG|nr:hypothetical protein PVAP13_5NG354162 [Panicum virgatum]
MRAGAPHHAACDRQHAGVHGARGGAREGPGPGRRHLGARVVGCMVVEMGTGCAPSDDVDDVLAALHGSATRTCWRCHSGCPRRPRNSWPASSRGTPPIGRPRRSSWSTRSWHSPAATTTMFGGCPPKARWMPRSESRESNDEPNEMLDGAA